MIINNLNAANTSNRQQVMAYAQTIMNFFTDAVEQNDCNVKVVIGFYTEIQDTVNSIKDLEDAFNKPIYSPDYWRDHPQRDWTQQSFDPLSPSLDEPAVIAEVKNAVKERCFNCRLKLPQVNLSFDRAFLFNRLKLQLEIYKVTFRGKPKFSLCQASFMFQRTCIPDLVRLLGLFLSAYAAILALRKLPKISLGVFVKAIIGQLIAKVVASLKLTIDMNSTGIPCIVTALKDIAHASPTNENVKNRLSQEQYNVLPDTRGEGFENLWPKNYKPISAFTKELQEDVKNGIRTQAEADRILDDYKRRNDTINYYADKLQEETDRLQSQIDEGIKMITDVVDNAVEDVNSYIDSILGVINFLQCENKRTGTDFSEVLQYINQLQQVINLISAIIAYMAKQFFRTELCRDSRTIKQLRDSVTGAPVPDLTTPGAISEIMQEWSGSSIKLDSEGLNLLVYEAPVKQMLPKLTLIGCNFKEFAQAHTLDNILQSAADEVAREERERSRDRGKGEYPSFSSDYDTDIVTPSISSIPKNRYPWSDDVGRDTPEALRPFRDPSNDSIINDTIIPERPGNTGGSNPDNTGSNIVPGGGSTSNPKKPTLDTDNTTTERIDSTRTGTGVTVDPSPKAPKIVDTVPLDSDPTSPIFKDWVKHIDELVDFIYNPLGEAGDSTTREPKQPKGKQEEGDTVSFYTFKEDDPQHKYHPSLQECRSVEDVVAILQGINL